jgi:hypothetical protein
MQLWIPLSPVSYAIPDRRLASVTADRACEISIRPEFTSPQLPLHLRATLEDLFLRYAFKLRYDLRHAVLWHRRCQKMYMDFVRANL